MRRSVEGVSVAIIARHLHFRFSF